MILLLIYVSVLGVGTYFLILESSIVGILFCVAQIVFPVSFYSIGRKFLSKAVIRIVLTLRKLLSMVTNFRPTVTVIIPTHNCVHYLRKAVESALASVGVRVSILIIDDHSTDGSRELAQELAFEDRRVTVVVNHKSRGAYFCRNIGMQRATSEFIAFLDSDDWQDKERLQRQISPILQNRKIRATYCMTRRWAEDLSIPLSDQLKLCHISPVFRKSLIEDIGYFDTVRFGADGELRMRLISIFGDKAIQTVGIELYRARFRPDSLTNSGEGAHLSIEDGTLVHTRNETRARYQENYRVWHRQESNPYVPFPLTKRIFSVDVDTHNDSPFLGECVIGFVSVNSNNDPILNDSISSLLPQLDALHVILSNNTLELGTPTSEKVQFHVLKNGSPENKLKHVLSELSGYVLLFDEKVVYPSNYVARVLTEIEIHDRQAIVGSKAMTFPRDHDGRPAKKRYPVVLRKTMSSTGEWVDLLGSGTIGFHSQTIQLTVAHLKDTSADDYVLAVHAASARIPQFSISRPKNWIHKASSSMKDRLTRGKAPATTDVAMSEFQLLHGDHPRSL